MTNSPHCPNCGSQKLAFQPIDASKVTPVANKDQDLFILLGGDVQCLGCGHVWNPAQRIQQDLDDQAQADALDFAERKESFYSEMEAGHLNQAQRLIPKEAQFIFKGSGLQATYAYLKSLDKEFEKFKRTYWLIGAATILLVAGGLIYACNP